MSPRLPRVRSIRTRLLAMALLAIVLLAGLGAAIWTFALKPALTASVARTQQEIADRAANRIDAFIEQRVAELASAVEFGLFWEDNRERQREIIRYLIRFSPSLSEVTVADPGGREVIRVSRSRFYTGADLRMLRGDAIEVAAGGAVYIGDVHHAATAEPMVTIAVPIKRSARETAGALVAEINLKTLWDPISSIRVGDTGSVYVLDRQGRLLAHRDYSKVLLGTTVPSPPPPRRPTGPDVASEAPAPVRGLDGLPAMAASAVVAKPQWLVVVEEPLAAARAGVDRVERLALGLMLLALGAGAAGGIWFSDRLVRPIRALEGGATTIARGELGHRLDIRTGDEIERLADEFNLMAEQLQASRADLERRVAEATRDLSALYALVTPLRLAGDWRDVLEGIMTKIVEVSGADGGVVRLLEGGDAVLAAALAGGEARVITAADDRHERDLLERLGAGVRSAAILPLVSGERRLGAIVLTSARDRAFGANQRELFAAIARQVSLAIENARLYAETRRTSEFLESIAKSTDPIVTFDTAGRVTYVSPRGVEVYGYPPAELLGRRLYDFYRGGEQTARELQRRLDEDGHVRDFEMSLRTKDGRWIDVSVSISLLRDTGNRIVGTVALAHDITDKAHLREQLRVAQKMEAIGRLAGGIAHDFNNLLTVIIGRAESLLRQQPESRNAKLIVEAGQRAAGLTRQLLAFSRKQQLERRRLSLNASVSAIGPMLRRLIGEDVDLAITLGAGEPWVDADPTQIEQILLNLAVNARDAMPQGGRLTIETSRRVIEPGAEDTRVPAGDYSILAVGDNGTGMSAETLSHIFEPFFTTKPQGQGTGLGLATVYGIVAQHEGHVTVDSALGSGTTFRIYLRRVEPAATGATEAPRESPRGSETVLLVEDEEPVRELVGDTLHRAGYRVLSAPNPLSALAMARVHDGVIDLLLTDVVMPHMNGRQLADRLGAQRPSMRLLFISGYVGDALDRNGVPDHSASLLHKPFTADGLLTRVREVLDASGTNGSSPAS